MIAQARLRKRSCAAGFRRWIALGTLATVAAVALPVPGHALQITPERPLRTRLVEALPSGTVHGAIGIAHLRSFRNGLSGLSGNLTRWGIFELRMGVSQNVEFGITGSLSDRLTIRHRKPAGIPLDIGPSATGTSDWGELGLATLFVLRRPGPNRAGFGGHLMVSLPTTDEGRGIGTNTTDVAAAVSVRRRFGRAALFAHLGAAILTAPLDPFEQNDVGLYGLAATLGVDERWTLFGEVEGRQSFRKLERTPLETESRGALRLGIALDLAGLRWDVAVQQGLTRWDPDWGLTTGVARTVHAPRRHGS